MVKEFRRCFAIFLLGSLVSSCRWEGREKTAPLLQPATLETLKVPEAMGKKAWGKEKGQEQGGKEPTPPKPSLPKFPPAFEQRVSLLLSEKMSLREIFKELARQTQIAIQLDPFVEKHVFLSVKNERFQEVLESLCALGDLRYRMQGTLLKIENDLPYTKTYDVYFLPLVRSAQHRISTATDVFAAVGTSQNTRDNGSSTSVMATATSDFWLELENSLKVILSGGRPHAPPASFSIHKQGGILSVFATERQHHLIENYLHQLKENVATQVVIEAKIIEVVLKEEYRGGINWTKLSGKTKVTALCGEMAQKGSFSGAADSGSSLFTLGFQDGSFSIVLQALEEFGVSRTLSSPRLTVLNNQVAVLKVAQNRVYFRLRCEKEGHWVAQGEKAVQQSSLGVSSEIHTVPIGLVLTVQPSINRGSEEVILFLRPTISRFSHTTNDPAVHIAYLNALQHARHPLSIELPPSKVPVVEMREIDSVLRLKNDEIGVLGGLMEVRKTQDESKVPLLSEIPVLGELFKATAENEQFIELVILIRVHIA